MLFVCAAKDKSCFLCPLKNQEDLLRKDKSWFLYAKLMLKSSCWPPVVSLLFTGFLRDTTLKKKGQHRITFIFLVLLRDTTREGSSLLKSEILPVRAAYFSFPFEASILCESSQVFVCCPFFLRIVSLIRDFTTFYLFG